MTHSCLVEESRQVQDEGTDWNKPLKTARLEARVYPVPGPAGILESQWSTIPKNLELAWLNAISADWDVAIIPPWVNYGAYDNSSLKIEKIQDIVIRINYQDQTNQEWMSNAYTEGKCTLGAANYGAAAQCGL